MKKRVFAFLIALIVIIPQSRADDKSDVTALAKKTIDAIIVLLQDKTLTEPACKEKLQKELLAAFDLPLTAKLTLGRKYWPKLNEEERKEFQDLFIKNLVNTYFDKAKLFADKKVNYEETVKVKSKIHVPFHCISKGEKIRINNKFYKSRTGWKVYDMEIQDISIVRSYSSQYTQILKDGTVADLLNEMRKIENNEEPKKK